MNHLEEERREAYCHPLSIDDEHYRGSYASSLSDGLEREMDYEEYDDCTYEYARDQELTRRVTTTKEQATQTTEEPAHQVEPTEREDSFPPYTVTTSPPSPPFSEEDMRMRGTDNRTTEERIGVDPGPEQNPNGRESPTPVEESFPDVWAELRSRIEELEEHIEVRNTHKRVKFVATRLTAILPEIEDIAPDNDRAADTSGAQTTLRWHEAMMAEILRKMGTRGETTPENSPSENDPDCTT